jgi:hypothetical protein
MDYCDTRIPSGLEDEIRMAEAHLLYSNRVLSSGSVTEQGSDFMKFNKTSNYPNNAWKTRQCSVQVLEQQNSCFVLLAV